MKLEHIDPNVIERAKKVRLLVLDVDGVLSDGKLYFTNNGEEIKAFNALDGHGIKLLQKSGVHIAIITGRDSQIVQRRAQNLGIAFIKQGREDKLAALEEIREDYSQQHSPIHYEQIAHMGDDHPDLLIIRQVGLGLTTANAHWSVKQRCHWQSQHKGGEGAVREACDLIMLAQDSFDTMIAPYL